MKNYVIKHIIQRHNLCEQNNNLDQNNKNVLHILSLNLLHHITILLNKKRTLSIFICLQNQLGMCTTDCFFRISDFFGVLKLGPFGYYKFMCGFRIESV